MSATQTNGTFSALIAELTGLSAQCAEQMNIVESSVLNWIHEDGHMAQFPLVDFQRMDFVQQLQQDIIAVLNYIQSSGLVEKTLTAEICESVLSVSKLEFTKMHIAMCFPDDLQGLQTMDMGNRETSDFEAF